MTPYQKSFAHSTRPKWEHRPFEVTSGDIFRAEHGFVIGDSITAGISSRGFSFNKDNTYATFEIYDPIGPAITFHTNQTSNTCKIETDVSTKALSIFANNSPVFTERIYADKILYQNGVVLRPNSQSPNTCQLGDVTYSWNKGYFNKLYSDNFEDDGTDITISSALNIPDNNSINIGSSNDFTIIHDGSNTLLDANAGHLWFKQNSNNKRFIFTLGSTSASSLLEIRDSTETQVFRVFASGLVRIYGNLQPSTDSAFDLGSGGLQWDDIYYSGAVNPSDRRMKEDIQDSQLGLNFIKSLRPVSYKWIGKTRPHYGFISQDVKESIDTIGCDFAGYVDCSYKEPDCNKLGLRYSEFISPIVKAIQEQQQIIQEQNNKINDLEVLVNKCLKRIRKLEN